MSGLVLDTHALVWYLLRSPRLSENALRAIEASLGAGDPIHLPSISVVEMVYLAEKGRITKDEWDALRVVLKAEDSSIRLVPLDDHIAFEVSEVPKQKVPELADRIIAATARRLNLPLVTKDVQLSASGLKTLW